MERWTELRISVFTVRILDQTDHGHHREMECEARLFDLMDCWLGLSRLLLLLLLLPSASFFETASLSETPDNTARLRPGP